MSNVIAYLDELLQASNFPDYAPNGLQVPGPDRVEKVVTGVSANVDLLTAAAAADADLVLVHHGLFWRGQPQQITPLLHARLTPLYTKPMALAAYHLPLDAHPVHGNSALLAAELRGLHTDRFATHEGRALGIRIRFDGDGLTAAELAARVRTAVGGREPLVIAAGPQQIRSLGIVTGAAADYLGEAIDAGLDAFLTGEPNERAFSVARDGQITFLAAGHHATETFGVQRIGELLARKFRLAHEFIDIVSPI